MMQTSQADEDASSEIPEVDTPLTDALVDQFASYYLLAVLAVKALDALREQRRRSETAMDTMARIDHAL